MNSQTTVWVVEVKDKDGLYMPFKACVNRSEADDWYVSACTLVAEANVRIEPYARVE